REEAGRRLGARGLELEGERLGTRGLGPEGERRFQSLDELVTAGGLRQDEVRSLAEVGALASFCGDRRTALWQAERAGRPAGPLLVDGDGESDRDDSDEDRECEESTASPLAPMTLVERVRADYDGTGLTIGPHPMALVRSSLATRGVARASDLARSRPGRRVRVAGAVITRQRPGTAKGFVFLSLEDETGIANIIVNPDIFAAHKQTIVGEPYLLVDGLLQNQAGAVSVKADRVQALKYAGPDVASHDFH
ncbi:MAG: OB-fold nucleic acid binding domain-containing protein, partial [Vicinamibacterales bacterium]